ncbi:MAG: DUF3793 family protein [Planctomycetia bacterium]|nr:DUF3793 family protein [Planctomycetia bacterium]
MITLDASVQEKEFLHFWLTKTAAVRCGWKPGELLRFRWYFTYRNERNQIKRLPLRRILELLDLPYHILRKEDDGVLILFYHPETMTKTLRNPQNARFLERFGFPMNGTPARQLERLQERFSKVTIPHEVGIFLGYPLKDVVGFIQNAPRVPVRGMWQVFGDPRESLRIMEMYREIETRTETILTLFDDLNLCLERIAGITPEKWKEACSCKA